MQAALTVVCDEWGINTGVAKLAQRYLALGICIQKCRTVQQAMGLVL